MIHRVIQTIPGSEHRIDTVRVFFSEKIQETSGQPFSVTNKPSEIFQLFMVADNRFFPDDSAFSAVHFFSRIDFDSIVTFLMSSGKELSEGNYLAIRIPPLICDACGNAPSLINQRIKVEIDPGDLALEIIIGTYNNLGSSPVGFPISDENPIIRPTMLREIPGRFSAMMNGNAPIWVKVDSAGVAFAITTVLPTTYRLYPEIPDTFTFSITDENGNVVQNGKSFNFRSSAQYSGPNLIAYLYWNGYTSEGEELESGTYTVKAQLKIPAATGTVILEGRTNFQIAGDRFAQCGCGTGTGLALLPPLGFWIRKRLGSRRYVHSRIKKKRKGMEVSAGN